MRQITVPSSFADADRRHRGGPRQITAAGF